jgi:hypothetical protein
MSDLSQAPCCEFEQMKVTEKFIKCILFQDETGKRLPSTLLAATEEVEPHISYCRGQIEKMGPV